MATLFGRITSLNVRKVVWAVQELGLDIPRVNAGGAFGMVREAHYLARNPNGLVPLLEDGDTTLWESNVIVRYLCARHAPGTLYPTDLAARFEAEKWMDWQQTTVNPAGRGAFMQWIRTPDAQRDMAVIEASVQATEPVLATLEAHLATQPFVGGAQFNMADIPLGCEIHRWFNLPQTRGDWPNIERWYAQLQARPAARGVLDQVLA